MNLSFAIYYNPTKIIPVKSVISRKQPSIVDKIIVKPTNYNMIDRIQNGGKCLACNKYI